MNMYRFYTMYTYGFAVNGHAPERRPRLLCGDDIHPGLTVDEPTIQDAHLFARIQIRRSQVGFSTLRAVAQMV